MDTMLSFRNNDLSNEFLTEEDLRKKAPYIFTEGPTNPKVSDKYVPATTIDVVRDMEKLGWKPVEAKQCRAKKGSSGIRSFHMVAFQNPDVYIKEKDGNTDSYVRIILSNSHDGFNSFKFMCGLYRIICSNGLVISDAEFANMSIRHINYNFEELKLVIKDVISNVPNVVNRMNEMRQVELTEEQKRAIAVETYKIRKGYEATQTINVDLETVNSILEPVRREDTDVNDLWTVYNICQEKMIKGGYEAMSTKNKMRRQRAITSIKKDIEYNQRLWEVAASYLPSYSYAN